LATALFVLLCAAVQWRSGAYSADVASHPDEPGHVVSGLMVHDYLRNLAGSPTPRWPSSPRAFAEAYYVHYPKVAIGHWPPLFYVVQAIWMFLFGRTKAALLLLMLLTMAATALLLFQTTRGFFGEVLAFSLAAVFLLFPISQQSLYAVMPDAPLALLSCSAMIAGGFGLEGRRAYWASFCLLTVAAIFTHQRGLSLILAPPIAILLIGNRDLFRRGALWIVAALAVPAIVVWSLSGHQTQEVTVASVAAVAAAFPLHVFHSLGPVFFFLVMLGVVSTRCRKEPRLAFVNGVFLGTWIFFSLAIVPWEDRYLIGALPACIVLAASGLHWIATRASSALQIRLDVTMPILAALAIAATLPVALPLRHKPNMFHEAFVREILAGEDGKKLVYLVAGDPTYEGEFIASAALQEPRAEHIVLRSTKALIRTGWSMRDVHPLFSNTSEMAAFLEQSWISLIVLQDGRARPDVEMLRSTVRESEWLQLPAPAGTLAYRRTSPLPAGEMKIRIDMRESLGKYLELTR